VDFKQVKWWGHKYPFRHFRAESVLDVDAYERVSSAFVSILETTEGRNIGPYRLAKTNPKYDALMLGMNEDLARSFDPFFSQAWLRELYKFVGLPEVNRIDGGLHSSPQGSHDGWIHNDLCSGWFDESSPEPGPFPNRKMCEYFNGTPKSKGAKPTEYIRAATMIYYLCNDGWRPGDGGETGLYPSSRMGLHTEFESVPPINNSVLLFECSPHSYHRFIANPGRTRNSIILWLHTSVARAESMWGGAITRRKES
jgi:2OG-Fe(II) oxygenase superfamily